MYMIHHRPKDRSYSYATAEEFEARLKPIEERDGGKLAVNRLGKNEAEIIAATGKKSSARNAS